MKVENLLKKNWKGSGDSSVNKIWFEIKDRLGPSEFLGYETDHAEGKILSLLKDNKEVKSLSDNDEGMIIINQTPFYGESGGQVGDTGEISSFRIFIPLSNKIKNFSSSVFKVSLINDSALTSSG